MDQQSTSSQAHNPQAESLANRPWQAQLIKWQTAFLSEMEKRGKSQNTLKSYRLDLVCLDKFLEKTNSVHTLQDFNGETIRLFKHFLSEEYKSINSIRRKLQTLRHFFDYLVTNQFYPENPIKKIASAPKIIPPVNPLPGGFIVDVFFVNQSVPSQSQLQNLLGLRNQLIIASIYYGALTVKQLISLEPSDVILTEKNPRLLIRPEDRDPFSIPLPESYQTIVESYLKELSLAAEILPEIYSQNSLFFNANGHKVLGPGISPRGIEVLFKSWTPLYQESIKTSHSEKNGSPIRSSIKNDSPTARRLRQSAILRWMMQKIPETTIKQWMGVAPSYNMKSYHDAFKTLGLESKTLELVFPELPLS